MGFIVDWVLLPLQNGLREHANLTFAASPRLQRRFCLPWQGKSDYLDGHTAEESRICLPWEGKGDARAFPDAEREICGATCRRGHAVEAVPACQQRSTQTT